MPHPGPEIRRRRRELGLTLKQVGAIAGLDIGALSRIERGIVSPRERTLQAIARAIGLDAASLPRQEPTMSATVEVGLLTLDAAADELDITAIGVQRLIARGQLRATRLGQKPDAPWRIAATEVARYVEAGAPDFDCPPLGAGWFADPHDLHRRAVGLLAAVKAATALDGQLPDAADGPPTADPSKPVVLRISANIRRALDHPLPTSTVPSDAPDLAAIYGTAKVAYAVFKLRQHARDAIGFDGRTPPIRRLYATPAEYQRFTGEAVRLFLAGSMQFGQSYAARGGTRVWRFVLPHRKIATGPVVKSALAIAF